MKKNKDIAYLAGGCFWCLDAAFRMINGVIEVRSGYTGGELDKPSYEQVCTGQTGHAETVEVTYDSLIIKYDDILDLFFAIHDPTTLNRQGNDIGSQYRSEIFYLNEEQHHKAEQKIKEVQKLWERPIVTKLTKLEEFFPAEDYHQDYFNKNPGNGYCQIVINPKLQKLKVKYANSIKKQV